MARCDTLRPMRRFLNGHFAVLAVLLCLQATATMMALRRDPEDRFRAATVSGLVWVSLRRIAPSGSGRRMRLRAG
jgi:hypothetical protein